MRILSLNDPFDPVQVIAYEVSEVIAEVVSDPCAVLATYQESPFDPVIVQLVTFCNICQ